MGNYFSVTQRAGHAKINAMIRWLRFAGLGIAVLCIGAPFALAADPIVPPPPGGGPVIAETPAPADKTEELKAVIKNALKKEGTKQAAPKEGSAPANPELVAADDLKQQDIDALVQALQSEAALKGISEKSVDEQAFEQAMKALFPLSPEQIKQVMGRLTESQKAAAPPPDPEPKAEIKVENLSLEPGVVPPTIYVANGYVTTMTILDVSGQPWPIQDVTIGGAFQLPGGAENGGHVLRIVPQTRFGSGNLSVRLMGLTTPLTFRLQSGAETVYYRYDARVPQIGPNIKAPLIDRGIQAVAGDDTLMAILEGVPPNGALKLNVLGTDRRTRAWQVNDRMYLRTPLTLLSPSWDNSVNSADGTNVYAVPNTPVLLLSDNGTMVRARIGSPLSDTPEDAVIQKDSDKRGADDTAFRPPAQKSTGPAQ